MAGADGDSDTDFPETQMAGAVDEEHFMNRPLAACFCFDLGQKLRCQCGMSFVNKRLRLFRAGEFTNRPQKQAHRTAIVMTSGFGQRVVINGFGLQSNHASIVALSTTADGREKCDLGILRKNCIPLDQLIVDGDAGSGKEWRDVWETFSQDSSQR